jgi:branched-chain amino acid transport system permease protein
MGFGAYTSAILTSYGVSPVLGVLGGLASAVLGALILGLPTLRLRGPYFIVSSMAFNGIFYEIVNNWGDLTNGPNGMSVVSYSNVPIVGTYLTWFVALLCLGAVSYIGTTRLGKSMMATRDDELAADAIGLRVSLIKSIAFAISGLLAGLSGILLAHMIGYISPETFNLNQSVFLLTLVLLGGVRRIGGVILGTLLMVFAQEVLRDFVQLQLLLYGTTMLIVILFVPRGIISLFDRSVGR